MPDGDAASCFGGGGAGFSRSHWSEELDPHRPLEGLAVDVEITDFPTVGQTGAGTRD